MIKISEKLLINSCELSGKTTVSKGKCYEKLTAKRKPGLKIILGNSFSFAEY